jgi:hypothetical protein
MSQANRIGEIMGGIDLGPTGGLQLQFAKLQLALAEMSKNNALGYIDSIQKSQEDQKKVSQMLQDARQAQADAKDKGKTDMSTELKKYMDDNGLAYAKGTVDTKKNTISFTKDEWEVAITSLKAHLDQLGTDTQQKMVFVQDFMGQYNSYLQGSNSAIQQANQTLAELARVR